MGHIRTVILSSLANFFEFVLSVPVIGAYFNLYLSWCGTISRLGVGMIPAGNLDNCERPEKPLKLYVFEGCPFCRRVRETCSVLQLDIIVYPCPRVTLGEYGVEGEAKYRPVVSKLLGRKCIFPVLVDDNVDKIISDSKVIVEYLWLTYGKNATKPWNYKLLQNSTPLLLSLPSAVRIMPHMGILITTPEKKGAVAKEPKKLLEFYNSDSCYKSRIVREFCDSNEISYLSHNRSAPSNMNGQHFFLINTPALVDPNTNSIITDYAAIINHLRVNYTTLSDTYNYNNGHESERSIGGAAELWKGYSTKGATSDNGVISSTGSI